MITKFEIFNEKFDWYDINDKLSILRSYIHILDNSKENYYLAKTYFIILHNFIIIERMFSQEVKAAGKEIDKYLKLENLHSASEVYNKFLELYDVKSEVRSNVETLDNIEEIKQYLNKNPKVYKILLEE